MTIEFKDVSMSQTIGVAVALALFVILIQLYASAVQRRWMRRLNQVALKSAEKYLAAKLGLSTKEHEEPKVVKDPRAKVRKKVPVETVSGARGTFVDSSSAVVSPTDRT